MAGTDAAYAATPLLCPGRSGELHHQPRPVLCDVRYWLSVGSYAMSGTDLAYAAASLLRHVRY
eukprot:1849656-Rhodomonas_salina.5